jgi:hypothetical protein
LLVSQGPVGHSTSSKVIDQWSRAINHRQSWEEPACSYLLAKLGVFSDQQLLNQGRTEVKTWRGAGCSLWRVEKCLSDQKQTKQRLTEEP